MWQVLLFVGLIFILTQTFKLSFKKTLLVIAGSIAIVIGYLYYDHLQMEKIRKCEGFKVKIAEIKGKWQTDEFILHISENYVIKIDYLANPEYTPSGKFTIEGNLLRTQMKQINPSFGNSDDSEPAPTVFKVCNCDDKELILKDINSSTSQETYIQARKVN